MANAIVLDGATAFASVDLDLDLDLDPGTYAEALGRHIVAELRSDVRMDLAEVVSKAIDVVARQFELRPGRSPSSTVTMSSEWSQVPPWVMVLLPRARALGQRRTAASSNLP